MPLWLALALQGCKPAGQREWRWLSTLAKVPFFPHDAPDTPSYAEFATRAAEVNERRLKSRPKGKAIAVQLPAWSSLLSSPGERLFVGRCEASVALAVFGVDVPSSWSLGSGTAARPVVNAVKAGLLTWQPVGDQAGNNRATCLVETLVHVVNKGRAEEGSAICILAGAEAEWTTRVRHLRDEEVVTGGDASADASQDVPRSQLQVIGFVTSPAPMGAPRTLPSMALCSAAAIWKLRSVQHYEPRRDGGMVHAWLLNSNSTALFPVRLALKVEAMPS